MSLTRDQLTAKMRNGHKTRTFAAAWALHQTRAKCKSAPLQTTAVQRYRSLLSQRYTAEIARRGGETQIEESDCYVKVGISDRADGLTLMGCDGWRQYSRAFGSRRASLSYLCGSDDNGPWAVRVPGTIATVAEAVEWVEPKQVRDARDAGRRIKRQGDVYAVESRSDRTAEDAADLPEAHVWNAKTRALTHRPEDGRKHKPMRVPYPARFFQQRVYQMGRGAGRGAGD